MKYFIKKLLSDEYPHGLNKNDFMHLVHHQNITFKKTKSARNIYKEFRSIQRVLSN